VLGCERQPLPSTQVSTKSSAQRRMKGDASNAYAKHVTLACALLPRPA
jgi:hypothetical protein